jgi:hypothetical protein
MLAVTAAYKHRLTKASVFKNNHYIFPSQVKDFISLSNPENSGKLTPSFR